MKKLVLKHQFFRFMKHKIKDAEIYLIEKFIENRDNERINLDPAFLIL